MEAYLKWFELLFSSIPIPLMEVWGRFGFIIGIFLMIAAYGGFTFRPEGRWGIGRELQTWDEKSFIAIIITFALIVITGYIGSSIVFVPGAQTFESLKDLSVFVCLIIFGYPALMIIPVAYGISDIIEGVPASYIFDWGLGYFINPGFHWIAFQFIGKDPDFRKLKTWKAYFIFTFIFMMLEPQCWGYICAEKFTTEISFHNITPSLFFTTTITWILAPLAMLGAYPLAKKYGFFLARNEKGIDKEETVLGSSFPLRMVIAVPFILIMLMMVGTTAFITLRSGEKNANMLINHLHNHVSENINLQLDEFFATEESRSPNYLQKINKILKKLTVTDAGRTFIIDQKGNLIVPAELKGDPVLQMAIKKLTENKINTTVQISFEIVTVKPLKRETWFLQANPYQDKIDGHGDWIIVLVYPEAFYLNEVRNGSSRFAMAFAIFLVFSLVLIAVLSTLVLVPLQQLVRGTQDVAGGNLSIKIPGSRFKEFEILATSFNNMTEKLQISNRVKSNFLDTAAHELRTPMTPITLLVQLIQKNILDGKPVGINIINEIALQIYRLTRLIDDLMDASRLERGELILKKTNADIVYLIHRCINGFIKMAPDRSFEYRGPSGPLFIVIDPLRIELVLVNLIDNAIKYTMSGGKITIKLIAEEQFVHISVRDNGIGISKEIQDDVFNKYYQLTTELDSKQTGMGLGLHICRNIVELHGGTIKLESEIGKGTLFTFTLPKRG